MNTLKKRLVVPLCLGLLLPFDGAGADTARAYSPDRKTLASASDDKTIKLWNVKTGELKHTFTGHSGTINALTFSPTESVLASVSERTIKLWNTKTGKLIINLQDSDLVNAITYSADGQTLSSASAAWNVSAKKREQLMFAQLSELPEKIQVLEERLSEKLNQTRKALEKVDNKLSPFIPENRIIEWFEKLHRFEKTGDLKELKKLELPSYSDKSVENICLWRKKRGVERLELNIQVNRSDLPQLIKLRKRMARTPVLARVALREEFEVLEIAMLDKLSRLRRLQCQVQKKLRRKVASDDCQREEPELAQPRIIDGVLKSISCKTQSLPHDGLFTRRNNAFGTKLTTGIKELIKNGVMIEQENIRFDDFVALSTKGIPSPKFNNALAVSYGIAAIPAYQKQYKDCRKNSKDATHYLEIALKTADTAPIGQTKAPLMNYIFVIDVSGSMAGEKLNIVKTSIEELFSQMRADDVIGVIAFNHQAKTLLKSTPKKNLTPAEFGKIINQLTANGETDINLALSIGIDEMRRYQGGQKVNQLFLFSDGNPTRGKTDWIKIRENIAAKLRQNTPTRGNIRLSTFAFGTDASKVELDRLAGLTGGQHIFVIEPEDVRHNLQQELDRRTHLAAINVQMQIEIDPDIDILHFYGHDFVTDPVTRRAIKRNADITGDTIKRDYGVNAQPHLITQDKGIRIFVPNLAVGETYWVVFELAVPENQSALGNATVQYLDTFARQNEKYQFHLSPKGQIVPQLVTQHALGLWTSEVVSDTLLDIEADDLVRAEKRIQAHISVLDTAISHFTPQTLDGAPAKLVDDVITLNKLLSLAKHVRKVSDTKDSRHYLIYELNELEGARNGFVHKTNYGR